MVDLEQVEKALPPAMKSMASQSLVDKLNNLEKDPQYADTIIENFLTFTHVLKDGKYKMDSYICAVQFVGYLMMGKSKEEAWSLTFPDRYQKLIASGANKSVISSHVTGYSNGKLVASVFEQAQIPDWILGREYFYKALKTQADLMQNANSELVRTQAANSILSHFKQQEKKQASLDLNINHQGSGLDELKVMMGQLANQQLKAIGSGVEVRDIAAMPLIEGQVKVIDDGF